MDAGCALLFEQAAYLHEGMSGRHHVINQENKAAGVITCAPEGIFYIPFTVFSWQAALCKSRPGSDNAMNINGNSQEGGDRPRDFNCLIKPAFTQALAVKRYGYKQIGLWLVRIGGQDFVR